MKIVKALVIVFMLLGTLSFFMIGFKAHAQTAVNCPDEFVGSQASTLFTDPSTYLGSGGFTETKVKQNVPAWNQDTSVSVVDYGSIQIVDSNCNRTSLTGTSPIYPTVGAYIGLKFTALAGGNVNIQMWDFNINAQLGQAFQVSANSTDSYSFVTSSGANTFKSRSFQLSGQASTNPVSIDLYYPEFHDEMITPDFNRWRATWLLPVNTATSLKVCVEYYDSIDILTQYLDCFETGQLQFADILELSQSPFINKTRNLIPTHDYFATAKLYDQNDIGIATGQTFKMTITNGDKIDTPIIPEDLSTKCDEYPDTLTSFNLPNPGYYFCKVLVASFYPSSELIAQKNNEVNQRLATNIPFSYYFGIKDKFTSIGTSDNDFSVVVPVAMAGYSGNWEFFNTNEPRMHSLLGTTRPYLVAILWLGFAWYLLKRGLTFFRPV
jgi:hypothetical protein